MDGFKLDSIIKETEIFITNNRISSLRCEIHYYVSQEPKDRLSKLKGDSNDKS